MNRLARTLFALGFIAMSAVGLSCDVNDYCLNCGKSDGGGDGDGGTDDGIDSNIDAPDAALCTTPQPEVCNNKDDDCDGDVDEGQLPTIGDPCDNLVGECAGGVKQCVNGGVTCTKPPKAESCDGLDNDCDGVVDDGDPGGGTKCGTDNGECVAGTFHCVGGSIQCQGAVGGTMPPFGTAEICDGKDNDCDNIVDDNATLSASQQMVCNGNSNVGECSMGTPTCIGGGAVCVGAMGPSPELCDGNPDTTDRDCDGNPTNGFFFNTDPLNCGGCGQVCNLLNAIENCSGGICGIAACDTGFHNNDGMASTGCEFGPCTIQGNEVCNGVDDDCDSVVDDNLTPPNVNTFCRVIGECATGTSVTCAGQPGFRCVYTDPDVSDDGMGNINDELACDGLDNDCDGAVDEGQTNLGDPCDNGLLGACRTVGVFVCNTANPTGPAVCNAPAGGAMQPEVCDGIDNNCNGTIDDGAATGNLVGQEWVEIPGLGVPTVSGVEMMKYEASHPDATNTVGGTQVTHACSRPNVLPWTNITYPQAVSACSSVGARLCTEAEWQHMCQPDASYPATGPGASGFTFIEAENAFANTTIGGRTWTRVAPLNFNGVTAMQVPDAGFTQAVAGNALAQSSRLDYRLDLAGSTNYFVWMRMRSLTAPNLLGAHTPATQTLSPVANAATAVGDLVIVTTFTRTTTNGIPVHTLQSGFTQLLTQDLNDNSNDGKLSVAYRVVTVAGAQTYTAYSSSTGTSYSGITVLRAGTYDLTSPVTNSLADTGSNPPNPPAVTLAAPSIVLAMGAWHFTGNNTVSVTPPVNTFVEEWEMTGSNPVDMSVASRAFTSGAPDPGAFGDNIGGGSVNGMVAATIAIRLSTTGQNNARTVWVGLNPGTSAGAANATPVSTTADNQFMWVVSPQLTSGTAGTHTFSIYLHDDGLFVDTIAVSQQGTQTPSFDTVWAYESNPRTPQPLVCNGDDVDTAPPVPIAASPTGATASGTIATFTTTTPHRLSVGNPVTVSGVGLAGYNGNWTVLSIISATRFTATVGTSGLAASGGGTANGDQDDNLPTGSMAMCYANHPDPDDAFDMSGNVKEWTAARVFGQNPIRGGAANNEVDGLTCGLNFTVGDNTFFFPNVGFRCCRDF